MSLLLSLEFFFLLFALPTVYPQLVWTFLIAYVLYLRSILYHLYLISILYLISNQYLVETKEKTFGHSEPGTGGLYAKCSNH